MATKLKKIITLSTDDFHILKTTGSVTINGKTLIYDDTGSTIYLTPDDGEISVDRLDGIINAENLPTATKDTPGAVKIEDSGEVASTVGHKHDDRYLQLNGGELTGNLVTHSLIPAPNTDDEYNWSIGTDKRPYNYLYINTINVKESSDSETFSSGNTGQVLMSDGVGNTYWGDVTAGDVNNITGIFTINDENNGYNIEISPYDGYININYEDQYLYIEPSMITYGDSSYDYEYKFPKQSGTLALTSDIPTNYVSTDTTQDISGGKTFRDTVKVLTTDNKGLNISPYATISNASKGSSYLLFSDSGTIYYNKENVGRYELATTNDLTNHYKKSETYSKSEVDGKSWGLNRVKDVTGVYKSSGIFTVDYGKYDFARANRFAFMPDTAVTIERSSDGGETWVKDTSITFDRIMNFFTNANSEGFPLFETPASSTDISNYRLRITLDSYNGKTVHERYFGDWRNTCIWVSTSHASGLKVTMEKANIGSEDTFVTVGGFIDVPLSGWSGPNDIWHNSTYYGGSSTQTTQARKVRFIFRADSTTNASYSPTIRSIFAYSSMVWHMPNNLMYTDHLYKVLAYNKGAKFPGPIANDTIWIDNNTDIGGHINNQKVSSTYLLFSNDGNIYYKKSDTKLGELATKNDLTNYINYEKIVDTNDLYTKSIPEGSTPYLSLNKVGGKTLKVVQLAPELNTTNWHNVDSIDTYTENGVAKFTAKYQYMPAYAIYDKGFLVGHKYLISCDIKVSGKTSGVVFGIGSSAYNVIQVGIKETTDWQTISTIKKYPKVEGSSDDVVFVSDMRASDWAEIRFKNVKVFDLTEIYGAGNEPDTVEEFEKDYGPNYYNFTEGSLIDIKPTNIKLIGSNLIDGNLRSTPKTESGLTIQYLPDEDCYLINGTKSSGTGMHYNLYHNIFVDDNVTLTCEHISGTITNNTFTSTVFYVGCSDTKNGAYRNWVTVDLKGQINNTAPTYVGPKKYIRHTWFWISGTGTFNNYKVRIKVEKGIKSTGCSPYKESNINLSAIPTSVLGRSVNEYDNYINFETKKEIRQIAEYVFTGEEVNNDGTEFWELSTETYPYLFGNFNKSNVSIKPPISSNAKYIICNKFKSADIGNYEGSGNGIQLYVSNIVRFRDSTLNTPEKMKAYLKEQYDKGDPVVLRYVVEPTEIDISAYLPSNHILEVEEFDNIIFENNRDAAISSEITYFTTTMNDLFKVVKEDVNNVKDELSNYVTYFEDKNSILLGSVEDGYYTSLSSGTITTITGNMNFEIAPEDGYISLTNTDSGTDLYFTLYDIQHTDDNGKEFTYTYPTQSGELVVKNSSNVIEMYGGGIMYSNPTEGWENVHSGFGLSWDGCPTIVSNNLTLRFNKDADFNDYHYQYTFPEKSGKLVIEGSKPMFEEIGVYSDESEIEGHGFNVGEDWNDIDTYYCAHGIRINNTDTDDNYYLYFPPYKTGTLALVEDLNSYLPKTGGTVTGPLTVSILNLTGQIYNQQYTYTLPSKSGTLATLDDVNAATGADLSNYATKDHTHDNYVVNGGTPRFEHIEVRSDFEDLHNHNFNHDVDAHYHAQGIELAEGEGSQYLYFPADVTGTLALVEDLEPYALKTEVPHQHDIYIMPGSGNAAGMYIWFTLTTNRSTAYSNVTEIVTDLVARGNNSQYYALQATGRCGSSSSSFSGHIAGVYGDSNNNLNIIYFSSTGSRGVTTLSASLFTSFRDKVN